MSSAENAPAACPPADRPYVLAATILASAMAFIDGSVVMIALPVIQMELGASFRAAQWIVNGYTLMLGALLLVGGGLGDRIGRRKVFMWGIAIFALASVACAAAPSPSVLVAGRVLQGIGAAALVPQSLAIIAASFPKDERGAAIGAWAAASAVTTALGPPLGGFLIDWLSWRAAFWINVPLAAAAVWLSLRRVPESRDPDAVGPVDWVGAANAMASLGVLTLGLTLLSEAGGSRAAAAWLIAAGLAAMPFFILAERRAKNPIMPLDLFRSRVFTITNVYTVFLYGALAGVMFLLPFELIERRGMSATAVGLTMLPFGLIIGLFSRSAGAAADRIGPRPFLANGALVAALGAAALAVNLSSIWIGVVVPVIVLACGVAAVVSPLTTAVMNSAPDARSGAASGVNNAASRLAGLIAVAALAAIAGTIFAASAPAGAHFGTLPAAGEPGREALEAAFADGYAAAMAVAALWALAAAAAALLLAPDRRAERAE